MNEEQPNLVDHLLNEFEINALLAEIHMGSFVGIGDFCVSRQLEKMANIISEFTTMEFDKNTIETMEKRMNDIIRY